MTLTYLLAGVAAMMLGFVEVWSRRKANLTLHEGGWYLWPARFAVDVIVAIIAVWVLRHTVNLHHFPWSSSLVTGLIAAGGATSFLRQRFISWGRTDLGVVFFYDIVRKSIDRALTGSSAERYSQKKAELTPLLLRAGMSPQHIAQRLTDFVRASDLEDAESLRELAGIRRILRDKSPAATDEQKLSALIDKARDLQAFRTIGNLRKDAESTLGVSKSSRPRVWPRTRD